MSRHEAARLALILVIAVTVAIGLGKIGRAAWVDHSTPAVATMCVLLALFTIAVVVWAASLPVDVDARPWVERFTAAGGAEITVEMGSVSPVWPEVDEDTCDTAPILLTHEFRPSLTEFFEPAPGRHRIGTPAVELLRREGVQP